MFNGKRYLVSVQKWDPYAGEGGAHVWKVFSDGYYTEDQIRIIESTMILREKAYAIGEVKGGDLL